MIYYVEDDDSIRELVVYTLNQMGMETRASPAEMNSGLQWKRSCRN